MQTVNDTVTVVETVSEVAANKDHLSNTKEAMKDAITPTSMREQENDWFCAQNVAALAATGTAVITMIGKRNCDAGALVGAAAGVATSYLGTKWLTEAIGCQNNGFGKAIGLFIGIDLGYGLTNVGINVQNERNAEQSVNDYL